jgi:cysteinyl-tRNA synthetase
LNRLLDAGDMANAAAVRRDLAAAGAVLGIGVAPAARFLAAERRRALDAAGLGEADVDERIRSRAEARAAKDWKRADDIRSELAAADIVLEDGGGGTTWRPASWGVDAQPSKAKKEKK